MTLPSISPMEPADLDAIMPLERQAFADPWTRRMYLSDLTDNPLATYRVIRASGPPEGATEGASDGARDRAPGGTAGGVALATLALPPILGWGGFWLLVDEAHIATVASHPEYRGCGLGQWLVVALLESAQERGAAVATLEVRASNLPAQKLYDKLGFDVVGTRRKYYRNGEDGLIMTTPPLSDPEIQARLETARRDALERVERCFGTRGATVDPD